MAAAANDMKSAQGRVNYEQRQDGSDSTRAVTEPASNAHCICAATEQNAARRVELTVIADTHDTRPLDTLCGARQSKMTSGGQ